MSVGNHPLPSEILSTCSDGFLYCFSSWASDVTLGFFWFFALLAFSFSIFLATIRFGSNRAFGFASFIGMIGGIWLSVMNLIPWWLGSSMIIIGVVGIAVLLISEK